MVIGRLPNPQAAGTLPAPRRKDVSAPVQVQLDPDRLLMAGYVRQAQNEVSTKLYPLHRQWAVNHALHVGQQYSTWSDSFRRVAVDSRVPRHRVRLTANVILPVIQTTLAMLLKSKPQCVVAPSTTEQKDKDAARTAEKILDYEWADCKLDSGSQRIAVGVMQCGAGFTKTLWDPNSGPVVEAVDGEGNALIDPDTGLLMVDKNGQPLRFQQGRVIIEVVPAYQILPDPGAHTFEELQWLVHTRRLPLSWLRENEPDWGEAIVNEPDGEQPTLETQFNARTAGGSVAMQQMAGSLAEGARVNEMWIKPGTRFSKWLFPDGARIVQCQGYSTIYPLGFLEARGSNPTEDWNPFTMYRGFEVGSFWPLPIVDNLAPLQREINRVMSNVIENARLMSRPKWAIPNSCAVSKAALTSEPGEKVYYNHLQGGEPHPIAMPNMPPFVMELLQQLMGFVDFVSNQHGPSRGQAPTGVKSAIGLSLLQEQDAMDMGPLTINWEESLARQGRQILLRVGQFWTMERVVQVVGKNRQIEAFAFSGADLGDNVDVRVMAGSGLPKSKAAQQALAEKLIQLGLLNPMIPAHRRRIFQIMELGIDDERDEDPEVDARRADHESEVMLLGMQPRTQWYYDHIVHLDHHLRFMKGDEYLNGIAKNPTLEAIFQLHVMGHLNPEMLNTVMSNPSNPTARAGAAGAGAGMAGDQQSQNNSMPGALPGLQGQQENAEQTMGGSGASEDNPSMGA